MATPTDLPRWTSWAFGCLAAVLGASWLALLWQNPPDPTLPDPLARRAEAPGMAQAARADWERILAAAPFGDANGATASLPETRLPLRLLGVVAESDPRSGRALIAAGGGGSQVYAVGAVIPGGATLLEIHPTQVILQRGGSRESLALPENLLPRPEGPASAAGARAPPGMGSNPPSGSSTALSQLGQVMTWQSVLRAGQPSGVRIYPGADAAAFEALGLRPGDLVVSVNQAPLTEATGSRDFAALLSSSPTLQLGIEREGRTQTLQIDVAQLRAPASPP